jgi:ABC-type nitrate/sulfonate/bicarbonate transport system substrate-binding protein
MRSLVGKKIGLSGPGAGSDIFTRYTLLKAGLDPDKDVSIQYLGTLPQILAAVDSNAIDCGIAVEPVLNEYQKTYDLTISWEKGEGPVELKEAIFLGTVTTQRFDDGNPGLLAKVDAAMQKSHDFLNNSANAKEVAERTLQFFPGIAVSLLEELIGSLAGSYTSASINAASLEASIAIWNTVSKEKITVKAEDLIATSIRNG